MPRHRWLLSLALCALPLHTAAANDAGDRHQQLLALFAEEWEFEARTQPEIATTDWGINRYNDQLSDYSAESLQAQYATRRTFAQRLGAIEPGGLSQEDQLNRELLQRRLELAIVATPVSACVGVLAYVITLLTERGRHTWRFGLAGLAPCTAVPVIIVWYQLNFGHWAGWMECDP